MTGWRLGYGVLPEQLVEPVSRLMTNSVSCTASFSQIAAIKALDGPQEPVHKMVAEFKKRREIVVSGLNSIPGIHCPVPKGAFYAFPNIRGTGMTSRDFANEVLEKAGVALLSGTAFGAHGDGYIRISFANSIPNLEEAMRRIKEYLAKRK